MAELKDDAEIHLKGKDSPGEELTKAKRELDLLRSKVEAQDKSKGLLILKKLDAEKERKEANKLMTDLMKKQDQLQQKLHQSTKSVQEQTSDIRKRTKDLTEKLMKRKTQLQQQRALRERLLHRSKICAELPDSEVEFVKLKQEDSSKGDDVTDDEPIRGHFSVCQEGALQLKGGQALITFEEERVVSQILQNARCIISFDDQTLEVKPKRIRTDPVVQFQIQLCVSRSQLHVREVETSMPKERVEERLELAFCRPSRGGAEVKSVAFDPIQASARVRFVKPGVAESLALRGEHTVDLDFQSTVKVASVCEHELHKFQSFCGAPKRTLLLDGITDTGDEEEMQDQLEIHFQKPSNGGGEIEHTLYTRSGLLAFFSSEV